MTLLVTLSKAFDLSKPLQQISRFKSTYVFTVIYCLHMTERIAPIPVFIGQGTYW